MKQSHTVQKLKSIEGTVRQILKQEPITRDSDKLLVLKVWAEQNPEIRKTNHPFVFFASDWIKGKYVDPDTITRARRKIQKETPELRGEKYKIRHEEQERTRKEINE